MKNLLLFGVMAGLLSFIPFTNIGCGGSPTTPAGAAGYTPVPTTPVSSVTPTVTMTSTPTVTTTTTPTVTATVTPNGKNIVMLITGNTASQVNVAFQYYSGGTVYSYVDGASIPSAGATWNSGGSRLYQSGQTASINVYGPPIPAGSYSYTVEIEDADTSLPLVPTITGNISSSTTNLSLSYTVP